MFLVDIRFGETEQNTMHIKFFSLFFWSLFKIKMFLSLSQLASNCIWQGICLENAYIPPAYPLLFLFYSFPFFFFSLFLLSTVSLFQFCLENAFIPPAYPLPSTPTQPLAEEKKSMVCLQGFLPCLTNNKAACYLKILLN